MKDRGIEEEDDNEEHKINDKRNGFEEENFEKNGKNKKKKQDVLFQKISKEEKQKMY